MPRGEILIIDDDEMLLLLARTLLEEAGYAVATTADGPQGIDIYHKRRPDIVLLDLGLPTMMGQVVLSKILEIDPRAKIIVITGYKSEKSAEDASRLGAVGFLSKPFPPGQLLEKIKDVISSK